MTRNIELVLLLIVLTILFTGNFSPASASPSSFDATIANSNIMVYALLASNGTLTEQYFVQTNAKPPAQWSLVLSYNGPSIAGTALPIEIIWYSVRKLSDTSLELLGLITGGITFSRTLSIGEGSTDGYAVSVVHRAHTSSPQVFSSCEDWFSVNMVNPDFVHSQDIKRQTIDVVSHWQFKSPAIIFQSSNVLAALVPDMASLERRQLLQYPVAMDLFNAKDQSANFSYGIADTALTFHSIYSRTFNVFNWTADTDLVLRYSLLLSGVELPRVGYQRVVRYLWSHFGEPTLLASPDAQTNYANSSLQLFEDFNYDCWYSWAQDLLLQFDCGDKTDCSALRSYRAWSNPPLQLTNNDGWFNAWFQNMRTSYGMFSFARRNQDSALMKQALATLNLGLHAPQNNGAFPAVFWLGDDGSLNWVPDQGFGGIVDAYHTFHMAWTGVWLLRWHADYAQTDARILPYCTALADWLISVQDTAGCVPSWFNTTTLEPLPQMQTVNAETAGIAYFWAELYSYTKNESYLQAAQKGMSYIESEIIPTLRWWDFETFLSCSPKPFDFYDAFTQQQPQNNLGKIQAAFAYMKLYRLTGITKYLLLGVQVLDYTLLTQQVINHPLLTPKLIGGFTTQNTDSEWSDARQGQTAEMLFWYYEETGELEYLQRAIGALRASFAVSHAENWAHTGGSEGDVPGAVSGIHWSLGSALTTVEIIAPKYGDAYVHISREHGAGINGCTLDQVVVIPPANDDDSGTVSFLLISTYQWKRAARVVIDGADDDYTVVVNGAEVGTFSPQQLLAGISVAPMVLGGK